MEIALKPWKLLSVSSLFVLASLSMVSPVLAQYSAHRVADLCEIAQGLRGWGWVSGYLIMEKARQAAIRD